MSTAPRSYETKKLGTMEKCARYAQRLHRQTNQEEYCRQRDAEAVLHKVNVDKIEQKVKFVPAPKIEEEVEVS